MKVETYQVITAVCSIIGCASVVFTFITLLLNFCKEKNHYEAERRLNTINFMNQWNQLIKKETRKAENIVQDFSSEQCRLLYSYQPIDVDKDTFTKICSLCSENSSKCQKCKVNKEKKGIEIYTVKGTPINELRGYTISYLNSLEIILLGWNLGIIDDEIITKEFKSLYNPSKNRNALKEFRGVASNGNAYPIIDEFISHLADIEHEAVYMKKRKKLAKAIYKNYPTT